MPVPGREERIKIMENLIEKRSIVEQVSVAQENLDEKEREQREKVREAAKTTVKASSWKEAAAAAGVTLVEAGEQTEKEEIVQKKKKSLKEMRTYIVNSIMLIKPNEASSVAPRIVTVTMNLAMLTCRWSILSYFVLNSHDINTINVLTLIAYKYLP